MAGSTNSDEEAMIPSKRQRINIEEEDQLPRIMTVYDAEGSINERSGRIEVIPTMRLSGHKKSVVSLAFNISGVCLCSSSLDGTCFLWSTTSPFLNYNVLIGHKNAVLDVKFVGEEEYLVTASADKTLILWDACTGNRIRTYRGHTKVVNSVATSSSSSSSLVVSGSDDGHIKLWDARANSSKGAFVMQLLHGNHQVTSVALSLDATTVYSGGIDNLITVFDIRAARDEGQMPRKLMSLLGHTDTITCLSLSPDGSQLLSNSMDCTMRSWDIRPFSSTPNQRHIKTFVGGTHGADKTLLNCSWSADGTMIAGGSSDRLVHVWDEYTTEELYCLPGHTGCVNSVLFHPNQNNIIASASSDKTILLGQLAK
jgi:Prp8 binding protein